MTVKLLTEHHLRFLSLIGSCTGSSESRLVKMPQCWKSRVTAHLGLSAWLAALWSTGHYQLGGAITVTVFVLGYNIKIYHECEGRIEKNPSRRSPFGIMWLAE